MKRKTIILGSGITGLATAYFLRSDYDLYEAETTPGGLCRSEHVDGFTFDFAERFIRFPNTFVENTISTLLGKNIQKKYLNARIYFDGSLIDYPFQLNLHGLTDEIKKECLHGLVDSQFGPKTGERGKNFEDWIMNHFGRGIAKHFMIPYNQKKWAIHPSKMNTDWFFSEFVMPGRDVQAIFQGALSPGSLNSSERPIRWYPRKGGAGALADALAQKTSNLWVNERAVEIDEEEKSVLFHKGKKVYYDQLVSTIPMDRLLNILKRAPQKVKNLRRNLLLCSLLTVNIGIDRPEISPYHWIYFKDKKISFARVYFPMNFSKLNVPEGKSSVSAVVTYRGGRKPDVNATVQKVMKDLVKCGIISNKDKFFFTHTQDIKYGFALPTVGLDKILRPIHSYLRRNRIASIGRYGNWEYSGIEHAIEKGKEVVDLIKKDELFKNAD